MVAAAKTGDTDSVEEGELSSLETVALPWIFTQRHPLDTRDVIRQAKDRGLDLDELKLRQLYRHRLLVPMVAVTARQHTEPRLPDLPEPQPGGTRLYQFREARKDGRLRDLSTEPFLPRLPFKSPRPYTPGWWNGLLYSQHQLAIVPRLHDPLSRCRFTYRDKQLYPRLPEPDPFLRHWATWYHRIAIMATALEARYLPVLDPEWVHLSNTDLDEYNAYRRGFDPVVMSQRLRYPAKQAREDAEELLLFAHSMSR